MRMCPRCGTSYPDDARFCAEDGVQLFAETDDPYIGQVFLKQFEVREICGRGSMGTVYRAWQTSMEREVAVKVLHRKLLRDEKVVKRFHREARASARLSHPNIIIVYMVGDTDDGVPFLVMEYVKGTSLDLTCAKKGPLPTVRAIHIAKQIAAALAEAHAQSIVHRDLKPENILLSSKKHTPDFVKVLDFGIAKILYDDTEPLTQTGAIFGTPHYLAPEQASGAEVDHRCDLYALGVILFRMATGRLPFQSASGMEVLIQHIKQAPPRPREIVESIPQPLEDLILKALEKSPDDRWQSAEQLVVALDRVVDQLRTGAVPSVGAAFDGSHGEAMSPEGRQLPPTQPDHEGDQAPLDQVVVAGDPAKGPVDHDRATLLPRAVPGAKRLPTTLRDAPTVSGSETLGIARAVIGRRRLLLPLVLGLISILGGSAAGAVAFWATAEDDRGALGESEVGDLVVPGGGASHEPRRAEPEAAPDAVPDGPDGSVAAPPSAKTGKAARPARPATVRPRKALPLPLPTKDEVAPVGPAPTPSPAPRGRPRPRPKPAPPADGHGEPTDGHDGEDKKPPPAKNTDDLYDMVP